VSRPEQSGGRVTATGEEGRHECAAPAGDCNREGGRGNTGAAAVHKAGEERRFGATPATATPLPSSWKARDPVRLSETRSLRVRARRKRPEGQGSHREACVCRRPETQIHVCADERSVRRTRSRPLKSPRPGSRSEATSAGPRANGKYLLPEGRACRRAAVVRRDPEAGREPLGGGRARVLIADGAARSAAPRAIATARAGGGIPGWRRCTKPVRSDAAARPRRLQRCYHLPPFSWKARDPVRPNEARPFRDRAREKYLWPEGQGSHREACVCRRPGVQIHVCADERSVRRTRSHPWKSPRTGSRSKATSAGTGQNKGYFSRRIAPVAATRSSGATRRQGESHLEWSPFRARPSEARSRLETGRHGKIKAGGPRQSPRSACLPTG
jgi:hypothetical protein